MLEFKVTQEMVEKSLEAKIEGVKGEIKLTVPKNATPEQFAQAIENLIARGKRNFSQACKFHDEATFENLITSGIREKLEPIDKAIMAIWKPVYATLVTWHEAGQLDAKINSKVGAGDVVNLAKHLWLHPKAGKQSALPKEWDRLTKGLLTKITKPKKGKATFDEIELD